MDKMRPGITLFITLSIIAVMFSLMGVLFEYLDSVRTKAASKASLIQGNLLANDFGRLLRETIGKKPSFETLTTLYTTPLVIEEEKGEFTMQASCSPAANRIPIAWIGLDGDARQQRHFEAAQTVFDHIVEEAELRDPQKLLESITAALSSTQLYRFSIESQMMKKKGIISLQEFRRLLDEYRFAADDPKVFAIDWESYFSFGRHGQEAIDADFITPELLAQLYTIDIQVVRGGFVWGKLDDFLREIGEEKKRYDWLFSKSPQVVARCRVNYRYAGNAYRISFDYIKERVEGFEFSEERE